MFAMWLGLGSAFAGDLTVTTPWPVNVFVDGVYRPYNPGTFTVALGQMAPGQHRIDVSDGNNVMLGSTMVEVPAVGVAPLVYDGTFWLQAQPAYAPPAYPQPAYAQPVAYAPQPQPQPTGPVAMDADLFQRLLGQIQAAPYSDGKLAVVQAGCSRNHVTIDQLGQMVSAMPYSAEQKQAVALCASNVVDPENAFALRSAFTYSSDANEALSRF